jgi:hypothetical protein
MEQELPQRNDDKLGILGPILDVVGDNRDVSEIEGSVDFVHKV